MLPPVTGLAVLVPDHAAQQVHRGVRAHQLMASLPVDRAGDGRSDGRRVAVQCVEDDRTLAPHVGHRRRAAIPGEGPGVVRLASTRRVERGGVEPDGTLVVHVDDGRGELASLRVAQIDPVGGGFGHCRKIRRWRSAPPSAAPRSALPDLIGSRVGRGALRRRRYARPRAPFGDGLPFGESASLDLSRSERREAAVNVVWGIAMAAIGAVFVAWGGTRSEFFVYRLLAARSRVLWGDRVHGFYQVVGVILVVVGLLWATLG